jgi:hypothetical protein
MPAKSESPGMMKDKSGDNMMKHEPTATP